MHTHIQKKMEKEEEEEEKEEEEVEEEEEGGVSGEDKWRVSQEMAVTVSESSHS